MTNPLAAFVSPTTPTLAELKERVQRDQALLLQRRLDIASALTRVAAVLGLPLEVVPANIAFLRGSLAKAGRAKQGIGKSRWANIRSLLNFALRRYGIGKAYLCPLLPAWKRLNEQLPDKYLRWGLSRFMHFCSAKGIDPDAVDQDTFDRFGKALTEETLVKHPKSDHQTACRLWNKARELIPEWPRVSVIVPRYVQTYAADLADCHPGLVRELNRYLDHLSGGDITDKCSPERPFRPASLRAVKGEITRYLGILSRSGVDLRTIKTLKQMVQQRYFDVVVRWLHERADKKPSRSLERSVWVIRGLAVKYVRVDKKLAEHIGAVAGKSRVDQPGLSAKNDTLLRQLDAPDILERFLTAADTLWPGKPPSDRRKIKQRMAMALRAQWSIAIDILVYAPMRIENLVNLDFARHLRWQSGKKGQELHIEIPKEEVKNNERLQYPLRHQTSLKIRHYVEDYRPLLMDGANTHLFPGRRGKAKDTSCLRRQITRAMFEHTGVRITPHQFRHITAKIYLDRNPGGYEVVRRALGHKSTSTTYKHYSGREVKAAVEHFDGVIASALCDLQPEHRNSSLRRQLMRQDRAPQMPGYKGQDRRETR